ncbi:MAG: DDE-type integrase/transposase/recombinase [Actinopolymorphaceae bacterium]
MLERELQLPEVLTLERDRQVGRAQASARSVQGTTATLPAARRGDRLHPDADLACEAIKMAVAARGGNDQITGVIFHTDRGSTYTANAFASLCSRLEIRQSMGRVGSSLLTG